MTIVEYLERYWGRRFSRSSSYVLKTHCCLPGHADRDASFTVYLDDGHFHCYGCGLHGDLLGLIYQLEFGGEGGTETWREVYRRARELGVATDDSRPYLPPLPRHRDADPLERRCLTIALDHYREVLHRSPHALGYLRGRGVRSPERLPVGYCDGSPRAFRKLASRLHDALGEGWRAIAVECGLLWDDGAERLRQRIFLAEERGGEVVYAQARALDPDAPKRYLNPRGIRKSLYGLESLEWDHPVVALVEGVFDALPLLSIGVPAVAILGNRMSDEAAFAKRVGAKRVAVMTDADETGEQVAQVLLADLAAAGIDAFRLSPDPYKDPGKWAECEGPEWIAQRMRGEVLHLNGVPVRPEEVIV